jgi:hypothetical protein
MKTAYGGDTTSPFKETSTKLKNKLATLDPKVESDMRKTYMPKSNSSS